MKKVTNKMYTIILAFKLNFLPYSLRDSDVNAHIETAIENKEMNRNPNESIS